MPPWLAANEGLLHNVTRTTSEGWKIIGVGTSVLFSEGQASVNLTAAVPSLHAAFTMLVALFLCQYLVAPSLERAKAAVDLPDLAAIKPGGRA